METLIITFSYEINMFDKYALLEIKLLVHPEYTGTKLDPVLRVTLLPNIMPTGTFGVDKKVGGL